MFTRGSIRNRLQLVIVVTTGASLVMACAVFIFFEWRISLGAARQTALSTGRITADASSAMLAFGSQDEADKLLAAFRSEPDVRAAALFDSEGRLFALYREPDAKAPIPDMPRFDGLYLVDRQIVLFYPVVAGEKRYGTLYLRTDLGRTYARLWRYGWVALGIFAGALLASFFIARFLQQAISRPVLALARTAQSISEEPNFGVRANLVQGGELELLTTAFNQMLDTIQQQQSQLQAELIERKRVQRALMDADRRKDEFLATLAHELRNPLAPLRNSLELLRRRSDDPVMIEQARGMMERQVNQMVRLVDDLLDVSRITTGRLQLRKERVELADVVRTATETAGPLVEARAHELTVTMPTRPVPVHVDPTRLAQVIANLLNNAAKYTERSGHIWLTAERRGDEAVVSVRDTGIGIPPEHLANIFGMFSQVAPALERSQGGLGIGLSLAKGLVELHGGSIEARSGGVGKGSEFTIRLPVAAEAVATKEPGSNGGGPAGARTSRILVVDDLRDATDSLAMLLQMMGHETRTAYDGLEAVQTAGAFQPDVILLDIGLPKMNGYEAARRIRDEPWGGDVTLVALTGWGQEEDKRRAVEAGFDHHLTKPVDPAALQELLAKLLPQR